MPAPPRSQQRTGHGAGRINDWRHDGARGVHALLHGQRRAARPVREAVRRLREALQRTGPYIHDGHDAETACYAPHSPQVEKRVRSESAQIAAGRSRLCWPRVGSEPSKRTRCLVQDREAACEVRTSGVLMRPRMPSGKKPPMPSAAPMVRMLMICCGERLKVRPRTCTCGSVAVSVMLGYAHRPVCSVARTAEFSTSVSGTKLSFKHCR